MNPTSRTTLLAAVTNGDDLDFTNDRIAPYPTRDPPRGFAVTKVGSGKRCVTVALHGELHAATALILFGQLAFFFVGDPWEIVADMSDVTLVDSGGVTALIDARLALRMRSCVLTIKEPSSMVSRTLELAGLSPLVETLTATVPSSTGLSGPSHRETTTAINDPPGS